MRRFLLPTLASTLLCTSCALLPIGRPTTEHPDPEVVTVTTAEPAKGDAQHNAATPDVDTETEPGATLTPNAHPNPGCPGEPNSPEITRNIPNVPKPHDAQHSGWTYHGDSNYDTCSDLSYATLMPLEYPSAEFEMQLMLFHKGEYLGVGALVPAQHVVIATDNRSVTVRYKDWEAFYASDDPNAKSENFFVDVTYVWAGDHVQAVGRIPNQGL
ncbi:LppP/LprE family lipoprotein [Corynebacterium sp.]|uniref:LppP/LprE family lipoprotein n=1 Tax=Corynebacterium sp. TaxID=1720 RepID=UPI0026DB2747|nr:LppP/LprE family lipoprotein [Corynebacterium sp.]MDO5077103.1 LppP/LprE family lipoprotein [Corynebacterium sp.]